MPRVLNVYALPKLVEPEELAGGIVVVIDVLRASTSIVHAIEAGAREVIPCLEVDDARAVAEKVPRDEIILGGERKGLPIDGFDLGNSPEEYTPDRVEGKTVVFTTTNGTRAMHRARQADRVLIGAFVNAAAVVRELIPQSEIHLLCAGTDGEISRDDILLAGMLVERVQRLGGLEYRQNAQAVTARETWLASFALPQALGIEPLEPEQLAKELCNSHGGQNLLGIGLERDILAAARIDRFDVAPEMDTETMRIRIA